MTLRNLFLFATLILAFSCQAQNLLENPDFIPSVYGKCQSGARGWLFYDWTRRKEVGNEKNPYHSGFDVYRFEFGKKSFRMDFRKDGPYPETRITLEENATLFLPPAPSFRLAGEFLSNAAPLEVSIGGVRRTFPAAPGWRKLDMDILPKTFLTAPLRFSGSFPRGSSFGLRDLSLTAAYPASDGRIFLPGGQTELSRILIPPKASCKEKRAALLWQGYLWRFSGKVLKIVSSGTKQPGSLVLAASPEKELTEGAYRIRVTPELFCVEVRNSDAHFPALCNFIRTLGFRLFSSDCIQWPEKQQKLVLKAYSKTFTPKFGVVYHTSPNKNCGVTTIFNGGIPRQYYRAMPDDWYETTHPLSFHNAPFLLPYSRYGKTNPEFYPMDQFGKRIFSRRYPQLCYGNKKSPAIIAERFAAWVANNPEYTDFYFEQNDGVEVCLCPECRKHRVGTSNSDNTILMLNEIAKRVAPTHVSTLAYTRLTEQPPVNHKPEKNVDILYCTWPSDWKCAIHPDCELNRGALEHLRGWAKALDNDRSRLSGYIYDEAVSMLGIRKAEQINRFGRKSLFLCINSDMLSYMINRWNWGEDPDQARTEFIHAVYGKAAPEILKYEKKLEETAGRYRHDKRDIQAGSASLFPYLFRPESPLSAAGFETLRGILDHALRLESDDSYARLRILEMKRMLLAQDIAKFPRSSCRTKGDLEKFAEKMKELIGTASAIAESKLPQAREWPWMEWRRSFNHYTPQRFFFSFAGLNLSTPAGQDWTRDPVILEFRKNPARFLTFMPKKLYNIHTGYYGPPKGFEWTPRELIGGAGVASIRYRCPARDAMLLQRKSSSRNVTSAVFNLSRLPQADKMLLEITGQDDDKPGRALWSIKVNGKTALTGKNPFAECGWSSFAFKFPSSCLKKGENTITITNLTPDPETSHRKDENVYDSNGTFLGTAENMNYQQGWIAVSNIRICESPDHQKNVEKQLKNPLRIKKYAYVGFPVMVYPGKKYRIAGETRSADGELRLCMYSLDSAGKGLSYARSCWIPGSETVLARPCKAGDSILFVKDASRWKKGNFAAAFNLSSPPALNTSPAIKEIRQCEKDWEIELHKPVTEAYPEGMSAACGIIQASRIEKKIQSTRDFTPFSIEIAAEEFTRRQPGICFFNLQFAGEEFALRNIDITVK